VRYPPLTSPGTVKALFEAGVAEARGGCRAYLLDLAESAADAPGCSPFAPSLSSLVKDRRQLRIC
jgi:hypothetical protein